MSTSPEPETAEPGFPSGTGGDPEALEHDRTEPNSRAGADTRRRAARERALGLLYEADAKSCPADVLVRNLTVAPDPYAVELVEGVVRRRAEIEGLISGHVIGWAPDRMPVLDRLVCEIAAYELLEQEEVPVAVVLSEAVDIATRFSTKESGRFVNGVLASVAGVVRG